MDHRVHTVYKDHLYVNRYIATYKFNVSNFNFVSFLQGEKGDIGNPGRPVS